MYYIYLFNPLNLRAQTILDLTQIQTENKNRWSRCC